MCLTMLILPVNAVEVIESNDTIKEESLLKPKDMVPNFLDLTTEETEKFVSRLSEYENTTDTIGFLNNDGTNTIFVYR